MIQTSPPVFLDATEPYWPGTPLTIIERVVKTYEEAKNNEEFAKAHAQVKEIASSDYGAFKQLFWLVPLIEKLTGIFCYLDAIHPIVQKDFARAVVILENAISCSSHHDHSPDTFKAFLGILLSFGDDHVPADPARARDLLDAIATHILDGTIHFPSNLFANACNRLVALYEKGATGVDVNQERANQIRDYFKLHHIEYML